MLVYDHVSGSFRISIGMDKKRILLCDGDIAFGAELKQHLEYQTTYKVKVLPDTKGLMNVMSIFKPDLILITIESKDSDAYAGVLLLKLSDLTKTTPIILLSTDPVLPRITRLSQSEGYMFKPVNMDKLEAIIDQLLQKSSKKLNLNQ